MWTSLVPVKRNLNLTAYSVILYNSVLSTSWQQFRALSCFDMTLTLCTFRVLRLLYSSNVLIWQWISQAFRKSIDALIIRTKELPQRRINAVSLRLLSLCLTGLHFILYPVAPQTLAVTLSRGYCWSERGFSLVIKYTRAELSIILCEWNWWAIVHLCDPVCPVRHVMQQN